MSLLSELFLTPTGPSVSFIPLMVSIENLTSTQLREAIAIKEQIATLEAELAGLTGDRFELKPVSRKRKMSPAGRAAIAAAAKARWAQYRGEKTESSPKRRRKMSAASRKRMAEAAKARWAKAKAAGKTRL
jgi:hypothetical protein